MTLNMCFVLIIVSNYIIGGSIDSLFAVFFKTLVFAY